MSDASQNPAWRQDATVAEALQTASKFLGSKRTLEHTLRNLRQNRRVIYTTELKCRADGTVRMDLLINASDSILSRKGLAMDDAEPPAPTPAATLSDPRR